MLALVTSRVRLNQSILDAGLAVKASSDVQLRQFVRDPSVCIIANVYLPSLLVLAVLTFAPKVRGSTVFPIADTPPPKWRQFRV